jgi:Flp pilus assembly protein TadG
MNMRVVERIFSEMRSLLGNESGSTVTFLAAAIIPLVAFSGLSIDTARGYLVKQRLAYSIEAAALAAAKADPSSTEAEIEAIGKKYFDANFPPGTMGIANPEVTYTISPNKREITVAARADMPTALMTVVGIGDVTVSSEATAQRQSKGLELAIALDNTGSMGSYIDDLKDAANLLVDTLYGGDETVENLWISVLPFDTRVNLANYPSVVSFTPSNSDRVCANTRSSPNQVNDAPPSTAAFNSQYTQWSYGCNATRAIALTAEKTTIKDTIDDMSAGGYTRIDEGAAWAYRMVSPNWRGLWGDADMPLDYNTALMDKAVIIMTDGENNPKDGTSTNTANNRLSSACTKMKTNNIIVYTIQYRETNSSLRTLLRNCATDSDHYFFAETDDLSAVFTEIANQLSNLRLLSVK